MFTPKEMAASVSHWNPSCAEELMDTILPANETTHHMFPQSLVSKFSIQGSTAVLPNPQVKESFADPGADRLRPGVISPHASLPKQGHGRNVCLTSSVRGL